MANATASEDVGASSGLGPSLVAFVCLLALYVATLAPSVLGGDSGELTASALTGGVPHPPGYPLFALLARLFAALPLGHSPAWRVNLLSALATATAAALLCSLVQAWTRNVVAGLLAAALFGTNSNVWLHATSAEVFGLNVMFVALAFRLWFRVEQDHCRRHALALALVGGLAMCNHHTFVFVGAPLLLRSLWVARRALAMTGFGLAIALGLLGLVPYAYLAVASRSAAAVSWGDLGTLNGFLNHVLRRSYGTFSMGKSTEGGAFVAQGTFFVTLWRMLGYALPRFLWVGPLLAAVGLVRGQSGGKERRLEVVLATTLGLYALTFCALSNLSTSEGLYLGVLERFFVQSDFMLAVASGLGVASLTPWLARQWPSLARVRYAGYACVALLLLGGVVLHGPRASQRGNRVFLDFATTALASLPPNAIVLTMGDHVTGSLFYFHEVEHLRPDIIHLDRELLVSSWYAPRQRRLHPDLYLPKGGYGQRGFGIKELLDGNPGRPLVIIDRLEDWDQSWKAGYKLATNGLVHPLVPASQFPTFAQWQARDRQALGGYDVMPAVSSPLGSWERSLGDMVQNTQGIRAHLALAYSAEDGDAPEPARVALDLLEDLVAKYGGDEALGIAARPGTHRIVLASDVWMDLARAYAILSRVETAYAPRVSLALEKFIAQAAPQDPSLPSARNYLETHPAVHH